MSISKYLRGLNEEQLEFAVSEAKRLLEEKHHEAKRLIWTVEDGHGSREKYFAAEDYLRAAECLLNLAKEVAPGWPKPMSSVRRMELRIGHLRIPESEYDEFYHAMVEKPEQQATPPETVLEMLAGSLSAAGFGGLYVAGVCGCKLEELSPTICLNPECEPGYLQVRSDGAAWVICSQKEPLSDQEIDGVADSC